MSLNDDRTNSVGDENETSANLICDHDQPRRPFRLTMELPSFLLMMGISLSGSAVYNIILYRTCVHTLNYSREECHGFLLPDKTNATIELEAEVQKYMAYISMVRMVMEAIVPAVLSLFIGAWSDIHGRKPLVVWPLFGISLSSMLIVVYSMLDDLGPWWSVVVGLPYSLTGGFSMLSTGAYCYVSDITTNENRSLRMNIIDAAFGIGSMIGYLVSSHLLRAVGNVYLLLIVTALHVFAYVFTNIFIKESLRDAVQGGLRTILNFGLVKEMVVQCFKYRPNKGRAQIILLAFANTLIIFIVYGAYNLEYLYTRQKLHWAMEDYTLYTGVGTIMSFVGGFVGLALFRSFLGLSDVVIAIVALASAVADCLIKALVVSSWQMYLASSIFALKALSATLIRSFLSTILPMEDTAKVFALLCVLDAFCPMVAPLLYNSLYGSTVDSFPGAIYMLSAGLNAFCVVLLGFVQYNRWSSSSYRQLAVSP